MPLLVENEQRVFADVLCDSIANFHLEQEELEFTATSYTLYLSPHRAWLNKFGETYTFDGVVTELLRRDPRQSHCCAVHLFEAMVVIERVDSEFFPILNEESRRLLRLRLEQIGQAILQTQAADGSWGPNWFKATDFQAPDNLNVISRLLATAHITQLLTLFSSSQLTVDNEVFVRATTWLHQATISMNRDTIFKNICPSTHTAWCLSRMSRSVPDSDN